jgi:tRNA-2-methylthio-N6-dimethylallyladenosine synthase
VFGEIGRLKKYKKHHPDLILGVAGCMPQDESVVDRLLKSYPYVDLIFGTHNIHQLPYYLESAMHGKERVVEVHSIEGNIIENIPRRRTHSVKAWVHIMFGCDEFCTYCIVPYTRGKERSRDPQDILAEVRQLALEGYQEVTLLGQNVNAYGRDFTDKEYTFAHLLADLHQTDMPRIRFMTSHPRDFDQATVDVLARGGNLMPHIHLPVQSGSNKILDKMNRKYSVETYLALVDAIYKAIPHASLTTDIIVGFPGETEEDFEATLKLVEHCRFEGAYTFIFSARSNTPAAHYEDLTPMSVKKERLQRLNALVNEGYARGHQRFMDATVEVLIDGPSKYDDTILAGYTQHNKLVNFAGDTSWVGQRIAVRVIEAKTWFLKGSVHEGA